MKDSAVPILVIAGFIALFAGIFLLVWYFNKKRREAWIAAANEMGLSFLPRDDSVMQQFGAFKIFGFGHSRKAKNVLRGRMNNAEAVLTDYQYTTGYGKNSTVHQQTLCLLRSNDVQLPHCFLRRQHSVLDFLGKVFGGQDINFDEDPDFSKCFVLQGENEAAVRQIFHSGAREYFLRFRGTGFQFEAKADSLLIHLGKRIKPAEARNLVEQAFEILRQWA